MTHERIQQRLSEWLDGELDPAASAAASRHIDECAACKQEVALLRRLGAVFFRPDAPAESRSTEAFVARVMARVDAEAVSLGEKFASYFLAPAFCLALAGLLLTIFLPRPDADIPLGVEVVSVDEVAFSR